MSVLMVVRVENIVEDGLLSNAYLTTKFNSSKFGKELRGARKCSISRAPHAQADSRLRVALCVLFVRGGVVVTPGEVRHSKA